MWKHELSSDLYLYGPKSTPYAKVQPFCQSIMDTIRQSTQFYFGELTQYASPGAKHLVAPICNIRLPYQMTLVCYRAITNYPDGDRRLERFACLLVDSDDSVKGYSFIEHRDEQRLCLFPSVHSYNYQTGDITQTKIFKNWGEDLIYYNAKQNFGIALFLVTVLSAKNVVTRCKVPPEKLNRKRIKHHKTPYERYYILEVMSGVSKEKYQGEVSWDYKSPENVAFHMCRGHFKTYTEDSPLFGKYAGTFWWQPQARGKVENGIITKDYKVTV